MTATQTRSDPSVWKYWWISLASLWRPSLWAGAAIAILGAPALVALLSKDADAPVWVAEGFPSLVAALCAGRLAADSERSGLDALLCGKGSGRGRALALRILTSLGFGLVVGLCGVVAVSFLGAGSDVVTPLLGALPGATFLALLASLTASYFRSAAAGMVLALVLWLSSALWSFAENPLFSLWSYRAVADRDIFHQLWPLNKMVLSGACAVLWAIHLRLIPASIRPRLAATPAHLLVLTAGILAVERVSGLVTALTLGTIIAGWDLGVTPVQLGQHLEHFRPLPAARLFGPAYAAYVGEGRREKAADVAARRLEQLRYAVDRWPHSVWAPALTRELNAELRLWFSQASGNYSSPQISALKYGISAEFLASLLDPATTQIDDQLRSGVAVSLLTEYPDSPLAPAAARYLFDYHRQDLNLSEAERYALAALRHAPPVEQPEWLALLARTLLEYRNGEEAVRYAKLAQSSARLMLSRGKHGAEELSSEQARRLEDVQKEAGQILQLARELARPHRH